jgi:ribosome-binding factor A
MRNHMNLRKEIRGLCAELSADDGLDPHAGSRLMPGARHPQGRSRTGLDRKAVQLCHQVAETLEEVLADCGDAVLQALRVLDVEPAPDASRLLVTVAVDGLPREKLDPERVHDHLARASGYLRSEVASAITRKRTPVLVYRLATDRDAFCD